MKRIGDHFHRSRATEFKKGVSGNARGRPPGTGWRQRAAKRAERLDPSAPDYMYLLDEIYFSCWLFQGQRPRECGGANTSRKAALLEVDPP